MDGWSRSRCRRCTPHFESVWMIDRQLCRIVSENPVSYDHPPTKSSRREPQLSHTPCNTSKNRRAPCLLRIPPPLQSVEALSLTSHSDPESRDPQSLHSTSPRDIVSHSLVDCDGSSILAQRTVDPNILDSRCAGVCQTSRSTSASSNSSRPLAVFQRPSLTQTIVRLITCQTAGRRDKILSNPPRSAGATRM
jgi:hypothetical protein